MRFRIAPHSVARIVHCLTKDYIESVAKELVGDIIMPQPN